MNRLFLLWMVLLPACGLLTQGDGQVDPALQQFATNFPPLAWHAGDTLSLPTFQFGQSPEESGMDSSLQIQIASLKQLISPGLLENADIDPLSRCFPLGMIEFEENKRAYLVGVYKDFHTFHTQLFLYDSLERKFTYTQSLDYLIGGGGFLSLRKAWMVDLNRDEKPDLIYRKDEIYNAPDPGSSYFTDTLRAEIWDGFRYVDHQITDLEMDQLSFSITD